MNVEAQNANRLKTIDFIVVFIILYMIVKGLKDMIGGILEYDRFLHDKLLKIPDIEIIFW